GCFARTWRPRRALSRRVSSPFTEEKPVMAVRLFVGNLPYDVTEAELRAHFAAIGPLASLSLATDRDTGKPRGFAFVEFSAGDDDGDEEVGHGAHGARRRADTGEHDPA